jgi:valyl-tRNA synthetase
LARATAEVQTRIDGYDFSHAALALYDFVYGELCDWYLELIKPRLRAGEPELAGTLLHVLTETLALAHPIIPFVTEEIYAHVPGVAGLLAARVQTDQPRAVDEGAELALGNLIEAIQALRGWRDSAGVKARAVVPARLRADGYEQSHEHLARLARLEISGDGGDPLASVAIPGGVVEILASEEVDLGETERKLDARREKLTAEIERAERKLANEGFVAKAPPEVVAAEREKLARRKAELEALNRPGGDSTGGLG